ncbi:hypothetical protein ALC56_03027, partial [Trachymyrmex septentrionalis]
GRASLNLSNSLSSLPLFVDDQHIGGRIKNFQLPYDACHPILLLKNHQLTQTHIQNLHAGLQGTISMRSVTRKIIQKFITCFKCKPSFLDSSRPFLSCGACDYVDNTLSGFSCRDLSDINQNRLVRWQRVEQLRQHFLKQIRTNFPDNPINQLQQRQKWKINKGELLKIGQVILVKQQNLQPFHWIMGLVRDIHPGLDNVAKGASIIQRRSYKPIIQVGNFTNR